LFYIALADAGLQRPSLPGLGQQQRRRGQYGQYFPALQLSPSAYDLHDTYSPRNDSVSSIHYARQDCQKRACGSGPRNAVNDGRGEILTIRYHGGMNFTLPPVTQALIVANVLVFGAQMATNNAPIIWLALWPIGADGAPGFAIWQLLSYSFLHAGLSHLFFNMLALFMFGGEVERLFGQRWYAAFYLVCVVTAAIAQLAVAAFTDSPPYPTIGASGGVFGLLLAFGMYFPKRTVMLLFPPIPMRAWLFVTLYGILELYLGITGTEAGVAHFAHLGGMLGGYLMIQQRRGWPLFARRR
jgi:membrane associated rhomboid family serine protease